MHIMDFEPVVHLLFECVKYLMARISKIHLFLPLSVLKHLLTTFLFKFALTLKFNTHITGVKLKFCKDEIYCTTLFSVHSVT